MSASRLMSALIGLAVCVIVVASLVVPAIEDSRETIVSTGINDAGADNQPVIGSRMSYLTPADGRDVTILLTITDISVASYAATLTVNGDPVRAGIVVTDSFAAYLIPEVRGGSRCEIWTDDHQEHNMSLSVNSLQITFSGSTSTLRYIQSGAGEDLITPVETPYTWAYIVDPHGDLVLAFSGSDVWVDRGSGVAAATTNWWGSSIQSNNAVVRADPATGDWSALLSKSWDGSSTYTDDPVTDFSLTTTASTDYATCVNGFSLTTATGTDSRGYLIVPLEYTYQTDAQHAMTSLLQAVPVLILAALLIAAASVIWIRARSRRKQRHAENHLSNLLQ